VRWQLLVGCLTAGASSFGSFYGVDCCPIGWYRLHKFDQMNGIFSARHWMILERCWRKETLAVWELCCCQSAGVDALKLIPKDVSTGPDHA
jgi:hypothetical protein